MERALRGLIVCALALAACAVHAKEPHVKKPHVEVKAIPFNSQDPAEVRNGRLTFLGGLQLSSKHWLFGGFSALEVTPDGKRMLALSDRATWWTADFVLKDGIPVGLTNNRLTPLAGADGEMLPPDDTDAEGMSLSPDGVVYASFERHHRISRFVLPNPNDIASVAHSREEVLPAPPGLDQAPENGGLEALARLRDGRLFALTEEMPAGPGYYRGWIGRSGTYRPIDFPVVPPYKNTDAAQLPNGDVLVLQRRYSLLGGLGARLCEVPAGSLEPGARVVCEPVAEMQPPENIDNMEGLAIRRNEAGQIILYMISDDNFSALQRTVLLVFRLEPPGGGR